MKRVKSACILQTLIFSQKPEYGYDKERALKINSEEFEHYKVSLERSKTRYQILFNEELDDGSIIIRVRKQYSNKVDVSEYFV